MRCKTAPTAPHAVLSLQKQTPIWGGKRLLFPIPSITKQDVKFLKELVEKGEYKLAIDSFYRLDQIVKAYKYVESGQKTGNVIIKMVLLLF